MARRIRVRRRRASRRLRRRVRPRRAKRSMRRSRSIAPNVASIIESFDEVGTFGQSGLIDDIYLGAPAFDRAQQVAKAYQEFRIKKIEVRFHFPFNAFSPNVSGGSTLPRWWLVHDPRQVIPINFGKNLLNDMGIKPRRAIGTHKVTFIPTALAPIQINPVIGPPLNNTPHLFRRRPWLPCSQDAGYTGQPVAFLPSLVRHYGLKYHVGDPVSPPAAQPFEINVRVTFQFRKPVWYRAGVSDEAAPAASLRTFRPLEDDEEEDFTVEEEVGPLPPPPSPVAEGGPTITPTSAKV